ncbi:rhomboid family intramembrane serine protease [Clostridium sp. D46t1_190503_E9]|uniref:rhomboid family intramembrane serine protease n=1 Tax=Clostridium sp. D46t1_190503_E9 TaxID=2787137 RepID=UPI00189759CF|nr:rhomboid family intramembrane serine protease [Clostridium sp. D46t1_190503_E9]
MSLLNKLEKKFGKFYIRNLMLIIVIGNAFVFALTMMNGGDSTLINNISLNPQRVMQGEVWRLVTFIFVPEASSIISLLFSLYFYYLAGTGLEHEWGGFKLNIYYLVGMIATIVVSLLTGLQATGTLINLSLFLAFARIYPDFQILLFYIIPIKVKYLAIFNWIIIGFDFITAGSLKGMILILIPVINYLIFFGKDIVTGTKSGAVNYHRKQKFQSQVKQKEILHKCVVCGVTEKDDPSMEFRYCSKCSGKQCYCINHIRDHEHK